MLRIIVILLLTVSNFGSNLLAQSKRDWTWVLGYPTLIPGQENTDEYGGMYMRFTDESVSVEKFDIFGGPVSATANDEEGNLLFYSNGCSVFNKNNQVMKNGSDINEGEADFDFECNTFKGYSFVRSGTLCLPVPSKESLHYLLYLKIVKTDDSSFVFQNLVLTEVDMAGENGTGEVLNKNQIILTDSLQDAVAACRHGNGRDWWIIIPRGRNRAFWKLLITPEGIQEKTLQTLPPPYSPYTAAFSYSIDVPPWVVHYQQDEYQFESWACQAIFSPDGTKYCRIIKSGDVEIYDFDRCSGELTLRRLIPVPPYPDYPEIPHGVVGLAIAPNNRFLYFNNNEGLFQFDMCEENIEHGDFAVIDYYDGFVDPAGIPANFFQMRNAPDGKIYMASGNSIQFLHVIERPNEKGKNCQFKQRGITLPRYTSWIINYFPNFQLYDLANSPCDTLGINGPFEEPKIVFDVLKIYPNPANQEINVFIPNCDGGYIRVWNMAGQLVEEKEDILGGSVFTIKTNGWPAGIYAFETNISNEGVKISKIIIAH